MLFSTLPGFKPEWVWLMIGTAILSMLYGNIVAELSKPSERRLWVAGVFVDLLRYVRPEVWNTTQPGAM